MASSERSMGESESLLQEEIEGKRRLYTELAESVPHGEYRVVDAGHVSMHFQRPDVVIQRFGTCSARDRCRASLHMCGCSHSDPCSGCIVSSTTASSSAVR